MHVRLRHAASAAAIALTLPALVAAGPPAHAPAYDEVGVSVSEWSSDTAPGEGIYAVGGDGQVNGEFVVAERGDVQIGLRITDRTDGPLEAEGKRGVARYTASTGFDGETTNRAEWNYDWHVDLRGSGTTLADYDLTLQTDIADPLFGDAGSVDLKFPAYFEQEFGDADLLDNGVLYQSSQNPLFGNDTFDPTAEGSYQFRLTLQPKNGGPSLSVKAVVDVVS